MQETNLTWDGSVSDERVRPGRPVETLTIDVIDGCSVIDCLFVDYMEKFGICDGGACEDDEEELSRKPMIRQFLALYRGFFEKNWDKLGNLTLQDFVTFFNYVVQSVDLVFSEEYFRLLMAVLFSICTESNQQIVETAREFLKSSQIFSFVEFRRVYEWKTPRKSKMITKARKESVRQRKIIDKIDKNLKNEKKFNKRNGISTSKMENMKDPRHVQRHFLEYFIALRAEIKNFLEDPQPFLKQLTIMECELRKILGIEEEF